MNKKLKNAFYQLSALLILFAAVYHSFNPDIARYLMVVGVAGFGAITFTTPYPGKSIRGKRLFNMQIFAIILMIVSAYLMFTGFREWVLPLLLSAILILYSAILIPREYDKEKRNENEK